MRPDEHKKKKSANYKKKKGEQEKKVNAQPKGKAENPVSAPTPRKEKLPSLDEDKDEPAPGAFRKKPIESNWDRYQPISDNEEDLGTDYNVLMSFAGDASSHIKFKYEEEWDNEDENNFLTIDHKQLSDALSSLPFVERYKLKELDIDTDLLEFVSNMDEDELSCKQGLKPRTNNLFGAHANDLGFDFSNIANSTVEKSPPGTTLKDNSSESIVVEKDLNSSSTEDKTSPLSSNQIFAAELTEDDKVIDELLTSSANKSQTEKPVETDEPQMAAVHDSTETQTAEKPDKIGTGDKEDLNEEVDDLEDWLDSIL